MKERKIYKRKIDMHKVRLINWNEPYETIGYDFFPSMPNVGDYLVHYKIYYIHQVRQYSNIAYIFVSEAIQEEEKKKETVEQLSLFQEDKSFMDKIKEKCKEVAHLLDKVK